MRTLIVAPNWIGDAVMAQPLVAQICRDDPDGIIDALAPPHVAAVFSAMTEITDVIEARNVHGSLQLGERWRVAQGLRARHYDRCFVLPNSLKSAIVPFLAGIPQRIGHLGESRYVLINHARARVDAKSTPMVSFYATLAFENGIPDGARIADPHLSRDPERERSVRMRLGMSADTPLVALCPGAEYGPAKRWPARHFAALANLVAQAFPAATIALLGSGADRAIATEIAALSGCNPRNLCGETSLAEALALLSGAAGVVSNDSGLMHATAAYGRPQVAVFGSSDPHHTPPRSGAARVEWLHLACAPCFERTCPLQHTDCLNGIAPERVFESLKAAMRDASPAQQPG